MSTGASSVREFVPIEDLSILVRKNNIVFCSAGPKGFLLLPDFPLRDYSFAVMKLELTSSTPSVLMVAYETEISPGFSPMRMVKHPLFSGRNTVFLAIPGSSLKGRLALYPGSEAGEYILHSLEVRGAKQ